jgi:hypothetical protein
LNEIGKGECRVVLGFKAYRIYENGAVWSIKNNQFLTVIVDKHGYKYVRVSRDGKSHFNLVHRLLYRSFVGEIPAKMQINHKDGIKINNALSNLEVVTPRQNVIHSWKLGLTKRKTSTGTNRAKLTPQDIPKIRSLHDEGWTGKKIGQMFGVHQATIHDLLRGETWKNA